MKGILKDANIFVAARYDLKRLQECIIKESNDINLRDDDGDTPLIHSAMVGKLDCLEYLLQNGADPNIQNLTGRTALMESAGSGQVEGVRLLIKANSAINLRDRDGRTALILAASLDKVDCVNELLHHGACFSYCNEESGETALLAAVRAGSIGCVEALIKAGVDINKNSPTESGDSPLTLAVRKNNTDIVQLLLKSGANVNEFGKWSETSLMIAAEKGFHKCLQCLLSYGADQNIYSNRTALDIATRYKRSKCIRLLNNYTNWGRRHIFLEFLYGANMINESPIATSNSVIRKRAIGHVLEINDLTRFICEYL